jgi:DNA-binding GntR family transcriptional regulator
MEAIPCTATTRVSDVVHRLEDEINFGLLPAGTWLKQADLERRLNCTRLLLREALNRLDEKGLVSLEFNRGYRVREVDERRLSQILQIRSLLEAEAIMDVAAHTEDLDFDALHRLAEKFRSLVEHGTVIEQEQANRGFHAAMLQVCPNEELVSLIFELRNRAPVSPNRRKNTHARLVRSAEEHFEMLKLLRAEDVSGVRELMIRHVLGNEGTSFEV